MALKGWNAGGTAQHFYESGIRLSMEQWGVEAEAIDAYLADETRTPSGHTGDPRGTKYNYERRTSVKIKWDEAGGTETNLERIITQKWIANYPMGLEAWAEFRRTGYPELTPAIDNLSGGVIGDMAGFAAAVYMRAIRPRRRTSTRAITMRPWRSSAARTTSR